jgi:hypothetical protein
MVNWGLLKQNKKIISLLMVYRRASCGLNQQLKWKNKLEKSDFLF